MNNKQQPNNAFRYFRGLVFMSMISATVYYVYYNVKYMDDIAAARIQKFELKSGMKIAEFKTESPTPEEITPEYIEKQKRKYRPYIQKKENSK